MTKKSDLVRKFITENPKIKAKKEIARRLTELYPEQFKDIETSRSHVRMVMGTCGETNRLKVTDPKLTKFFYSGFNKWAEENLNVDPRPWDDPFVIPTSIKQLNIIADLHSIHLDHKVLTKFLKQTTDKTALLLNGDLMDSESLSRHLKGHNLIEYDKELEICHQILKGLKEEFDHVYFKEGNHDAWLERYLLINAREIFRARGLNLKELLRLGELRVHHIHNLKYVSYGDLDIVHSHEFPGFGMGKFPATGLLDKWQTFRNKYDVKVLGAHCHRFDKAISKKSKDGKHGYGYTIGSMCRKSAAFNPYAGWDNGWAVIRFDGVSNVEFVHA